MAFAVVSTAAGNLPRLVWIERRTHGPAIVAPAIAEMVFGVVVHEFAAGRLSGRIECGFGSLRFSSSGKALMISMYCHCPPQSR